MGPTVERVFGAEVTERPVGCRPIILIHCGLGSDDEVRVAGSQSVEHGVVGSAGSATQSFLGGLSSR